MTGQHTILHVAHHVAPDLRVVSTSNPEPVLRRYNVVGVYDAHEDARKAVVALEGIEADDTAIGVTVLGTHEAAEPGIDPEGVTRDVAPRVLVGSLIGAVVGAVLVGAIAGIIAGLSGALAGAIGGALFGAAVGAVWGAFVKMGGSDAYRQTFVTQAPHEMTLVSLHTEDGDEAVSGFDRLAATPVRDVLLLDADGDPTSVPRH